MGRLKTKKHPILSNSNDRMKRYEDWVEDVKERKQKKLSINNSGKGAKEEARNGIFNKKQQKLKEEKEEKDDSEVIIDDGFDGLRKKQLIADGKNRGKNVDYKEQVLQTKKEAVNAFKDIGRFMERAFKTDTDYIGELVNWVQDNVSDVDEQNLIIDNIYDNEKRWAGIWRGIMNRKGVYDEKRIKEKISDFYDRFKNRNRDRDRHRER